jgi:hypothetical protein
MATNSVNKKGKVLYDFQAQADNQISLRVGQILPIVAIGNKGGWSKGVDINGKRIPACKSRVFFNAFPK